MVFSKSWHHTSCFLFTCTSTNGSAERKHRHIVEVALSLHANASVPLKYWDGPFLLPHFSSIFFPSKFSILILLLSAYFILNPMMSPFIFLVVHAGLTLALTTKESLLFDLFNSCLWVISLFTKEFDVLTYPLGVYIFLMMLFYENIFPLFHSIQMLALVSGKKLSLFPNHHLVLLILVGMHK
jgi:hypothetical protein